MTKKSKKKINSPKKEKKKPFNLKHKLFADEYLIDHNSTQAYKRAYQNENLETCRANGHKLLMKTDTQAYLKVRYEERKAILKFDGLALMEKNIKILDADYTIAEEHIKDGQLGKMPHGLNLLVQGVKVKKTITTVKDRNGSDVVTENETREVKFMSKDKAKEELGKQTGSFAKDNDATLTHNMKGFAEGLKDLDI